MRTAYGTPPSTTTAGVNAYEALSIATLAALIALPAADARRRHGEQVVIDADGSRWMFHSTSVAADASGALVQTPTAGTGVWLRIPGSVDLALPVQTFASADAAVIFTMPVGSRLIVRRHYWDNSIAWTGGASSSVGLSSGNALYNTKGDLGGGAGGDLAAGMTAIKTTGSAIGAKCAAGILLQAADTVRFDRIVSIYTAGSGIPHLVCDLLLNPGV